MSSIDDMLDALFATLMTEDGKPVVDPHMNLRPDRSTASYFIAAPHPTLNLAEMRRPDQAGVLAELERVLGDLPAERRDMLLARLKDAYEALAAASQDEGDAQPSSLIYALH